ncbi:hypothetical protein BpHYR1_007271 [Brachionus plicatilis]|uniref:Uncharacterized protein n=1 Tax=Brachionus plicatilis TaxID=10195 RepID=A0A3M7PJ35_BRAPC|nr:hypothetical protein BpHYR1_007271 [Brachionus plicatilis]
MCIYFSNTFRTSLLVRTKLIKELKFWLKKSLPNGCHSINAKRLISKKMGPVFSMQHANLGTWQIGYHPF